MTGATGSASDADGQDGLAGLRLSPGDLQALARQGFVATEARQGRGPSYKLRWRRGGRQRVRYLGPDPGRAEQVRAALEALQRPHRIARRVAQLLGEARKRLLNVKRLLEPHADACGFRYHGYTTRRPASPGEHEGGGTAAEHPATGLSPLVRSDNAKEGRPHERQEQPGAGDRRDPGRCAPDP